MKGIASPPLSQLSLSASVHMSVCLHYIQFLKQLNIDLSLTAGDPAGRAQARDQPERTTKGKFHAILQHHWLFACARVQGDSVQAPSPEYS
jgi:hypothetical protein